MGTTAIGSFELTAPARRMTVKERKEFEERRRRYPVKFGVLTDETGFKSASCGRRQHQSCTSLKCDCACHK